MTAPPRLRPGRASWWRRSLTVRLTLLATAATALVLLIVLTGLLVLFSRQLDRSVDAGLRARLGDLQAAVASGDVGEVSRESFAALYRDGRVLRSSVALLEPAQLLPQPPRCPGPQQVSSQRVRVAGREGTVAVRVLATCQPDGTVLVIAASVEAQHDARERLLVLLTVAAPLLLVLVALTVGRAVHAALRPVDALTRQAQSITDGSDVPLRLPAAAGEDEIARLATTLEQMLARLAASFAREQAFVDDASHELRTPITVISGELELALAAPHDPAVVIPSLQAASAETARLRRLTEDLLVLARERARGTEGRSELAPVVDDVCSRLATPLALTLTVDCAPGLDVSLTAPRVERLLTNLLQNARTAGAHAATLTAHTRDGGVVLIVEDDGPGFLPAFLPVAFERFARDDAARSPEGTGLGLAIVRAVVTEAGGSVSADNDSRLGGAAVRMYLPLAEPAGGSARQARRPRDSA